MRYEPFKTGVWVRYTRGDLDVEGEVQERNGGHLILYTETGELIVASDTRCQLVSSHVSHEDLFGMGVTS